jgi:outer membrane lipoprotein-sorting protein
MKTFKALFIGLFIIVSSSTFAQTADEIISNYFENTGGLEKWKSLKGIKMSAKVNQGGMEIPLEIIQMAGGKQMTVITFQGKEIKQGVFDGTTLWSTNFMTQKAEKSDQESTDNLKLDTNDFPDSFLGYKEKGYTVELVGKETIDGAETFKVKLIKEQVTIDGKKEDNISYYFFDTENYVPIAIQSEIKSGPMKGQTSEIKLSDYQEVDGFYFPFTMIQGLKGQAGQPLTLDKIELNPTIDDALFQFPEEAAASKN